jgi:opacity protein-like surface antigen
MLKLRTIALAACACAATAVPVAAADLAPPVSPIILGGWYLRGDIGYSNQHVDSLDNALYAAFDSVDTDSKDFDGGPIFDIGVGYRVNNWLRFDVTGEYRSAVDFHGLDIATSGPDTITDEYTAQKSEWLALLNAYVDIGNYRGLRPYVGAGIGMARVNIDDFTDFGAVTDTLAFGEDHSEWNFAWALYAGLGFEVTPAFTIDLGYRYLDMGDGESGDLITSDGTNLIDNPMIFEDITSHDVRLGVRYELQ